MSSWSPNGAPEHKGKMHQPKVVDDLDTSKQSDYLKNRCKEDDSDAVNMTDAKLGKGIRNS
jgi:hypothetical protein